MITGYRHAAYDTPWQVTPSRREGRFHRPLEVPTQYLSLHPLGPAAEMLRHHVGPAGVAAADTLRLNLWAAQIVEDGLVAVDFPTCAQFGITPEDLVGEDYAPCQALAARQRLAGGSGMIVPSAALPGTHNVILFGVRVLHPYLARPATPEEVCTGHLTDRARAPREVQPLVRWLGTPHTSLEVWRRTGSYPLLDDPVAGRLP